MNEDMLEFEIDFIAATYMFGGMSYERARAKAVQEWREFNAPSYPEDYEIADCGCVNHAEDGVPCPHDKVKAAP